MELGLAGKTVIVTGGGSNIGRAIAIAFAQEGSNVVIADLDEVQGKKVADEINAAGKGSAIVVKTDVTSLESVETMVKKASEKTGAVDVLVNNVGWDKMMFFANSDAAHWDKVIALNYRSVLNTMKSVLPLMKAQKKGAIVNIGSDAGRMGEFTEAVYSGAKGGVIALSKAVAREEGRNGIRVNVLCPGLTPPPAKSFGEKSMWTTDMNMTPEQLEKAAKGYPLRRVGTPNDVAYPVVFLASDAAGYVTGQTLSASGGYTMM